MKPDSTYALPIASAPRDGTVIIALNDLGYPYIVCWDENGFFDERDGSYRDGLEWWAPIPTIPRREPVDDD